jgi:hypothetical protein
MVILAARTPSRGANISEGWSQIGQWSGVPLHVFLQRVGADLKARYVSFKCFDGYSTSIDMPSALHPQTILALDFVDKPLRAEWVRRCGCGYRPSSVSRAPRTFRPSPLPTPIRAAGHSGARRVGTAQPQSVSSSAYCIWIAASLPTTPQKPYKRGGFYHGLGGNST